MAAKKVKTARAVAEGLAASIASIGAVGEGGGGEIGGGDNGVGNEGGGEGSTGDGDGGVAAWRRGRRRRGWWQR